MKINEKNLVAYASCTSPVDKEGYLSKKGDVKGYQRRWFVLKGNLLFYFDKVRLLYSVCKSGIT